MECKNYRNFHSANMCANYIDAVINFTNIGDILTTDESILSVHVVDYKGNVIASKMKNKMYENINMKEDVFPIDLVIVNNVLEMNNSSYGKTISLVIKHEKIQQLVYFLKDYFLYVMCKNYEIDTTKIFDRIGRLVR